MELARFTVGYRVATCKTGFQLNKACGSAPGTCSPFGRWGGGQLVVISLRIVATANLEELVWHFAVRDFEDAGTAHSQARASVPAEVQQIG